MTDASYTEITLNRMSATHVSFFLKRHTKSFITLFSYFTLQLIFRTSVLTLIQMVKLLEKNPRKLVIELNAYVKVFLLQTCLCYFL